MTRMTGPDCVVMCNLINTYTHTHTHTHTHRHTHIRYVILRGDNSAFDQGNCAVTKPITAACLQKHVRSKHTREACRPRLYHGRPDQATRKKSHVLYHIVFSIYTKAVLLLSDPRMSRIHAPEARRKKSAKPIFPARSSLSGSLQAYFTECNWKEATQRDSCENASSRTTASLTHDEKIKHTCK